MQLRTIKMVQIYAANTHISCSFHSIGYLHECVPGVPNHPSLEEVWKCCKGGSRNQWWKPCVVYPITDVLAESIAECRMFIMCPALNHGMKGWKEGMQSVSNIGQKWCRYRFHFMTPTTLCSPIQYVHRFHYNALSVHFQCSIDPLEAMGQVSWF